MSKVPKASLELDDDYHPGHSVADAAVADGVEEERCVVAQYRTTHEQKQDFLQLLSTSSRERIPVEWVIDIADESDGWFYATAYGYNDTTHMLYVMVPDKENPTFEGEVQLDHRTVHLLECVDGHSLALFNKIVRDSLVKVRWDVEWYDEEVSESGDPVEGSGQWLQTSARYLVRLANQVLVQDRESGGEEGHGWVMVIADENLKLVKCHKNKGVEDFYRLVLEGNVLSDAEVYEEAQRFAESEKEAREREQEAENRSEYDREHERERDRERDNYDRDYDRERSRERSRERDRERGESRDRERGALSTRKMVEYARSLRENLEDIIEEREIKKRDDREIADLFHSFILNGDLDQGAQLMHHFGKIRDNRHGADEDEERIESIMDEAKHSAAKLQRSLSKIARNGSGEEKTDDAEKLRQLIKKLEKEVKELKIRR